MSKIHVDRLKIEGIFKHYPKETAIFIASDGNAFLTNGVGKSFCKDHCTRVNATYALLTREQFATGIEEINLKPAAKVVDINISTTEASNEPSTKAPVKILTQEDLDKDPELVAKVDPNWKASKWDDMIAFAKSEGLEATTTKNKGKNALITEIENFLGTKSVGGNAITNHQEK